MGAYGMEFTPGQAAYNGYGGGGQGYPYGLGNHGLAETGDSYTNELPPPPPAALVGPPPPRPNQQRQHPGQQMHIPNEAHYNGPMYPSPGGPFTPAGYLM